MGRRLLWSVICLVPLFYISMGHMMGPAGADDIDMKPLVLALAELVLVIPIIILNRAYFTVGFSRLFRGSPIWLAGSPGRCGGTCIQPDRDVSAGDGTPDGDAGPVL